MLRRVQKGVTVHVTFSVTDKVDVSKNCSPGVPKVFLHFLSVWQWCEISFTVPSLGLLGLLCSVRIISLSLIYDFKKQVIHSDTKKYSISLKIFPQKSIYKD